MEKMYLLATALAAILLAGIASACDGYGVYPGYTAPRNGSAGITVNQINITPGSQNYQQPCPTCIAYAYQPGAIPVYPNVPTMTPPVTQMPMPFPAMRPMMPMGVFPRPHMPMPFRGPGRPWW